MNRASLHPLPGLLNLRWLAVRLCAAGLPLLVSACAQPAVSLAAGPVPPAKPQAAAVPPAVPPSTAPIRLVRATQGEVIETAPRPVLPAGPVVKQVPITLDAVLRMAGDQNLQIALARERVRQACAEKRVADMSWIPNIYVGTSYYRHDGGIQNEDGTFINSHFGALFNGVELNGRFDIREATFQKINAERKVWQQRGELAKMTTEQVMEAANTYIDLLSARTSLAATRELEKPIEDLLAWAEEVYKVEPGTEGQVEMLRGDQAGYRQTVADLEQRGNAAAAKLAYLLGLDPTCIELVPLDARLVPMELVNADLPLCDLVKLALENGPGVYELERLLALIHSGLEKARSPAMMLPTLETRMAEGGFGAGPGGTMSWDNRWDMNLQARWNVSGFLVGRDRQKVAQSGLEQVHLTFQDVRGKLTTGVLEAREAIQSGREQISWGEKQLRHFRRTYQLSWERVKDNIMGASVIDVQQTIRQLQIAQLRQLAAINSYDKAQIRLMMLLGPAYCNPAVAPLVLPPADEGPTPVPEAKQP